ncbi:MAG: M20/M25/M40 family metallo-hydrolase, partial [Congregibacter sp.]|nr:M20/M25/M40 family metallo-hydrolase [Congregibacter sp.]
MQTLTALRLPMILVSALALNPGMLHAAEPSSDVLPKYSAEMEKLTADARVQAALAHVLTLQDQSREELIELTEIPAPPFKEDVRAAHFATMLKALGLKDVQIDGTGNVIGRRPGKTGSKVVAYAAHLDTVFPEGTDVTVKMDGDKMRAPGIGDNTRGLVTLLEVIAALDSAGIETDADLLFIGNVGEEGLGDLSGVKYLFRDGAEKIDTFIAVDGGNADRIVYG